MSTLNDTLKDLQQRAEQTRDELNNALDKGEKALRGLISRVEERSSALFDELVKTGEKFRSQQDKPASKKDKAATDNRLEELTNRGAALLGLPTREDVAALEKKLASMQRKLTKLEKASA